MAVPSGIERVIVRAGSAMAHAAHTPTPHAEKRQSRARRGRARAPIPVAEELEKIFLVGLLFAVYFLIARAEAALGVAGHDLGTSLDRALPFVPGFIYPYVTLWVFMFSPFVLTRTRPYYRRLFTGFAFTLVVAYALYVGFPTQYHDRPVIDTSLAARPGFTRWLVGLVYSSDAPYNCFPSMHVALSLLSALAVWRIDRASGRFALGLALAILVATVLVKQHYLADVVAGAVLALVAHELTLGRFARRYPPDDHDHRERRVLLIPLGIQALGMAGVYGYYAYLAAQVGQGATLGG